MTESERSGISRMRCNEIMTRQVKTVSPDATLSEAARMMRDADIGAIPVIDQGKLVGIVTDRDIVVRSIAAGQSPDGPVSGAMTKELATVHENDFVFEAVRLMGDKQVRRIPVINNEGGIEGIVAMADVALESEDQREIAETLEEISSGASFWNKN